VSTYSKLNHCESQGKGVNFPRFVTVVDTRGVSCAWSKIENGVPSPLLQYLSITNTAVRRVFFDYHTLHRLTASHTPLTHSSLCWTLRGDLAPSFQSRRCSSWLVRLVCSLRRVRPCFRPHRAFPTVGRLPYYLVGLFTDSCPKVRGVSPVLSTRQIVPTQKQKLCLDAERTESVPCLFVLLARAGAG